MRRELVDHRVLGAIRFRDAVTGQPVDAGLTVSAAGAVIRPNRSGAYVIWDVATDPALHAHIFEFGAPPATPAAESVSLVLQVRDPAGLYLPWNGAVRLPRQVPALLQEIDVLLFPGPGGRTGTGWAVIRATVREEASEALLPWSLVRVRRVDDNTVIGSGQADWRGEALVAIAGLPVTTWNAGDGAVLTTDFEVQLEVVFDQDHLKKITDAAALAQDGGFSDADSGPNPGYIPDPASLAARPFLPAKLRPTGPAGTGASTPAAKGKIASGRTLAVDLLVTLP